MNERIIEWLIALGIGGVLIEGVRSVFMKKNMGADYADTISTAAVRLLAPLEARIKELEVEVETVKEELNSAKQEAQYWREAAEQERARFEDGGPHHHY